MSRAWSENNRGIPQKSPRPFGRGLFLYGEPFRVPRDASENDQAFWASALEVELNRLTDAADAETGIAPEDAGPEATSP